MSSTGNNKNLLGTSINIIVRSENFKNKLWQQEKFLEIDAQVTIPHNSLNTKKYNK